MKKSMKLWLVLAIVVLLAVAVPSLVFLPGCNIRDDDSSTTDINKGTVVGTVTDAGTGNGIENVTVTIVEQSAKAVISDETDADGMYNLPNVAPGTQTITAKKSGYANYSQTVEVTENITVTQDISMNAVIASTVTGSLTNSSDGSPIVGAKVWIDEIQDYSDSTGDYVLNGVSAGQVVLRATMSSYSDFQLTLAVEEGTTVTQNISLDEANAPAVPTNGKSNIYGRVTAAYKPVSNATVNLFALSAKDEKQASPTPSPSPTAAASALTDTDGTYQFLNVDPGSYRVEVVKDGYDQKTETITATADANARVDTVSLAGGPSPSPTTTASPTTSPTSSPTPGQFTTKLCSQPRAAQVGQSINGRVDDSGTNVVFQSNEKISTLHTNAFSQIYRYNTGTGTVTLVSMNSVGLQGDGNSTVPAISPDGAYIAFTSAATNLVTGDAEGFTDIFLYKMSDATITRISTKNNNPLVGANGNSDVPYLSDSTAAGGFFCVFQSAGDDIIPTAVTPTGQTNIFRVKIDKATGTIPAANTLLISQIPASTGNGGVPAPRNCANPMISRDGKFVVYESDADALVTTVASTLNTFNVYFCDTSKTVATWTARASQDAGGISSIAGAGNASVSDDGKYVAFGEGVSTAWGSTNVADVFRVDTTSKTIDEVSGSPGGADLNSFNPWISADGRYVAFNSLSNGLVQNDTNNSADCFVRDVTLGKTSTAAYTRVSLGVNGEQANDTSALGNPGSIVPFLTGNYVVFHSSATNLVTGVTTLGANNYNVYIRKWK